MAAALGALRTVNEVNRPPLTASAPRAIEAACPASELTHPGIAGEPAGAAALFMRWSLAMYYDGKSRAAR